LSHKLHSSPFKQLPYPLKQSAFFPCTGRHPARTYQTTFLIFANLILLYLNDLQIKAGFSPKKTRASIKQLPPG